MENETYDLFFLDDMTNLLTDAITILEEAEKQQRWDSAIPFLFRTFHSLKGAAPMAGMLELGKFLHRLEDLLASAQNGQLVMDGKWGNFLLAAIDVMYVELEAARQGESLAPFIEKHKDFIAKLPRTHPNDGVDAARTITVPSVQSHSSKPLVKAKRLMILCFVLIKEAQMPEIAVLVLEQQYREVGQVQSMVLAHDGERRVIVGVIETVLASHELKKIAAAAEVAEIYVQPFLNSDYVPMQSNITSKELRRQIRILVVEDDADLLMLMCKVLEKRGYASVAVTTAEEALQLIESEKTHILITDISLPGLNGMELIRLVKKRDAMIQVIVITGLSGMQNAIQALELGATEYLVKPLSSMGEMIKAVEVCVANLAYWWARLQKINERRG